MTGGKFTELAPTGTDLDIDTPMTIKGPGAGKVIISGEGSS